MGNVHNDPRAGSGRYEVRVKGHLDSRWTVLLDGFSLSHPGDGTTVLTGYVVDQAALHSVLRTLGDIGLPLLYVGPMDQPQASTRTTDPRHSWQSGRFVNGCAGAAQHGGAPDGHEAR